MSSSAAALAPGRPTLLQLILPFWRPPRLWRALALLAIILCIMFGATYLRVWANRLTGDVTDALLNRQWTLLATALFTSVVVGVGSASIVLVSTALQGVLELSWRTWMTENLLLEWAASGAYYDVEREGWLSNADQRIAEDVKLFVHSVQNMSLNVVSVLVNTVTFTVVLWQLSGTLRFSMAGQDVALPGYMVYLCFAYEIGSFLLAHWIGKKLIGLNMQRQTVEADFRFSAMQLRENAEQIAFYGGGKRESSRLTQRLGDIILNTRALIARKFKLGLTQNIYINLFFALPTLGALPRYVAGEITLGGITRMVGAYHALTSSLSYFTQVYGDFTELLAVSNRLRDLHWALHKARHRKSGFSTTSAAQPELSSGPLQLRKPNGETLASVAPWRIAPGQRWLVRGPSGCGKSTMLRAVAGLWPHGDGAITLPAGASLMFLPQRSYVPAGTLKAAICYPAGPEQFDDQRCLQVLALCGLQGHTLGESDQWQRKLSGGEQQRLAFARVLLHRPDFIFLDEATSALDDEGETALYQHLIEQLPGSAVISVAHRAALARFHDQTLDLTRQPS